MTQLSNEQQAAIIAAAEKLVRCKGRYHSEQNYRALAALFGVNLPDLPPLAAEAQEPVAWRYRHVMPYMKNADGSMGWVMPWRYVETEGECNPSTNYQREALYAAPQPVAVPGAVDYSDLDPTSQDREVIESIAECKGWNACRAAMLQPSSGALQLPDGWKLVPVEPTAEMISSGIAAHYERSQIQIHDRPAPGPMECAYVAMLNAAPVNPEFTTQWIPCSERMPEVGDVVLTAKDGYVNVGEMERSGAHCRYFTSVASGRELPADYWMPLPTAQQEPTK